MNKVVVLALMWLPVLGWGQEKTSTLSKADQFSAQAGKLIEKQFIDVGKIKGVEIDVVKFKDLLSNTSVSSLRFEYTVKATYTTDTKRASLDLDEIDGLVKSIKLLQTEVIPSKRDTYTEVTFSSRTGLQAGAYFDVKKSSWEGYLQIEKHDSKSLVFLTVDDLGELARLIESAVPKM